MSNKGCPRIFYCGMVNTPSYTAMIGEPLHIGAASNKMIAVVRALRDAGAKAYLVSIPVLGRNAQTKQAAAVIFPHRDGPQIFLPVVANRYMRKIYAVFSFAWFCTAHVAKYDRVILYNHAVEYFLGLLILAVKGNRPLHDIEDSPRTDEQNWQGFVGRTLFYIFNRFTSKRKLIVSEALARILDLRQFCVVYGAARKETIADQNLYPLSWDFAETRKSLRIHYGGSLCTDTGIDLFCAATDRLIETLCPDDCQVHFIVTGFGSDDKIRALQNRGADSAVRISFYPNLSPQDYLDQFRRCHAALSLKLPESQMTMTTFPSKVVEITTQGLLLISTNASDVPLLFDARSAVLLSEATPRALADAILSVLANPLEMQQIARQGQERAMELFESKRVGTRIVNFILNDIA